MGKINIQREKKTYKFNLSFLFLFIISFHFDFRFIFVVLYFFSPKKIFRSYKLQIISLAKIKTKKKLFIFICSAFQQKQIYICLWFDFLCFFFSFRRKYVQQCNLSIFVYAKSVYTSIIVLNEREREYDRRKNR